MLTDDASHVAMVLSQVYDPHAAIQPQNLAVLLQLADKCALIFILTITVSFAWRGFTCRLSDNNAGTYHGHSVPYAALLTGMREVVYIVICTRLSTLQTAD